MLSGAVIAVAGVLITVAVSKAVGLAVLIAGMVLVAAGRWIYENQRHRWPRSSSGPSGCAYSEYAVSYAASMQEQQVCVRGACWRRQICVARGMLALVSASNTV